MRKRWIKAVWVLTLQSCSWSCSFKASGQVSNWVFCSASRCASRSNFTRSTSSLALSCTYVHRMQGERREGLVQGGVGRVSYYTVSNSTSEAWWMWRCWIKWRTWKCRKMKADIINTQTTVKYLSNQFGLNWIWQVATLHVNNTAKNGLKWQQQQFDNRHQCSITKILLIIIKQFLHQVISCNCRWIMVVKKQNALISHSLDGPVPKPSKLSSSTAYIGSILIAMKINKWTNQPWVRQKWTVS